MRKTQILGIVPYEGMRTLLQQCAAKFRDVELSLHVGDLEAGAEIARNYAEADFDVILSRGGTAELIQKSSPLPVVEIPLSAGDILRALKLAENYNNKYAIIGFPAITKNAHFLCDVLRYDIDIYTIHNEEEAAQTLQGLSREGYTMVLCDVITQSLAQRYGILAILITSGAESMDSAIEQAVQTSRTFRLQADRTALFQAMLQGIPGQVFAYTSAGELVYHTGELSGVPAAVLERMRGQAGQAARQGRIALEAGGELHTLWSHTGQAGGETYTFFTLQSKRVPLALSKNGIWYRSREEVSDSFFNSFFGVTQSSLQMDMTVEQYAEATTPLMILGEVGTGKDQMARLLYTKGSMCTKPMVTLDCAHLHDKGWRFLMEHENSPLGDEGTTIHVKNSKVLGEKQFLELCGAIRDRGAHHHNRLLFTCTYREDEGMSERHRQLVNSFACLTLHMPPMRHHKEDIPNLASLYISILNMRMAREIVGLDPDAMAALQQYDWPHNYDQFKRVMEELVTACTTPYISCESVARQLKREVSLMYMEGSAPRTAFDLSGTLDEINKRILTQVLAEEKGNQSAAAKRLGISRTTLWRMAGGAKGK